MNNILSAAIPIFGMLACLFVGFIIISESRSGGRAGYWLFALAVVWLIASGVILWPGAGAREPATHVALHT